MSELMVQASCITFLSQPSEMQILNLVGLQSHIVASPQGNGHVFSSLSREGHKFTCFHLFLPLLGQPCHIRIFI
uniref:Putative ovule protein n=1 Tax=Solanum chacoense TaxID=4108 RepID=A0A0V0IE22_SOLCH